MAHTAGTNPHVYALTTLHAWVLMTPVFFDATQFKALVLLSDEILRQKQLLVNFEVFHAANESLSAGCTG